jgi:hypothetical protein
MFTYSRKHLILIGVFFLAFLIHLIGINQMGRTWDEEFKVDMGYSAWSNLAAGDFKVEHWNFVPEHPMVGKYIYSIFMGPHMIRIDDGEGHIANLSQSDYDSLLKGNYIKTQIGNKLFMISYDYTAPRLASAAFNALAVTLTVFIALYFLSELWAVIAGLFLLVTPRFIAMGQLITFESLSVFLFVLTIPVFYKLLEKPKDVKHYILTGILCGLLFWTRYNNYFIFIFLTGWLILHYLIKRNKEVFNYKLILIPAIAFLLGILIWPLMWHDFPKYLIESFVFHKNRITPSFYYLNRLIFTTPIPIIVGSILGIVFALKERKYWQIFLLWWFFSVIITHLIIGVPGGGTRYIIIIYPVLAILSAYGYFKLIKPKWVWVMIPLFIYMVFEMFLYFPYYLDYYNLFTGGVSGAAKRNYEVSWWGEGQREVGMYINKNIPPNSSVGLMVAPKYVFPATRLDINNLGFLEKETPADYLVVTRWLVPRLSKDFVNKYQVIYTSKVRNEPLVLLYKNKKTRQ